MHYVYILYSEKLEKLYVGSTGNLKKRINAHNQGAASFTSRGIPWKLLYYQAFINKTDASREELFLKTGKGRERIKYLLKHTLKNIR